MLGKVELKTVFFCFHTTGIWHEQSRTDRDKYVEVLWHNIKKGDVDNFVHMLDLVFAIKKKTRSQAPKSKRKEEKSQERGWLRERPYSKK